MSQSICRYIIQPPIRHVFIHIFASKAKQTNAFDIYICCVIDCTLVLVNRVEWSASSSLAFRLALWLCNPAFGEMHLWMQVYACVDVCGTCIYHFQMANKIQTTHTHTNIHMVGGCVKSRHMGFAPHSSDNIDPKKKHNSIANNAMHLS